MKKRIIAVILIIALCLMTAGCGRARNAVQEKPSAAKKSAKSKEKAVAKGTAPMLKLPGGYPVDLVPIMESAELTDVNFGAGKFEITFKVGEFDETIAFYEKSLPADIEKTETDNKKVYSSKTINENYALNELTIEKISDTETIVKIDVQVIK